MGDTEVRAAVSHVLSVLREAGRAESTVRRHQIVLDRFAVFLAGRGLDTASEGACVDFITDQTGVRLGSLWEPVKDRDVQAVRRPVLLLRQALAGRTVEVDRSVVPLKDGCPAKFGPLRDDYLAWCRGRGNAEATLVAKDKAVSRFLGYLDEGGADDLAGLGVRNLSGFFVRQRGLRRKTVAAMRSSLRDFLVFSATAGKTPQGLADQLPPQKHVRHESEPHLWTAQEICRVLTDYLAGERAASPRTVASYRDAMKLLLDRPRVLRLAAVSPRPTPSADLAGRWLTKFLRHDPHPGLAADADPLFHGPNHSRLTRSGVAKLLARHVHAIKGRDPSWAPGPSVTPHTLRRSRAMHLSQAGVNLIYIRDLLGHADVSTTEVYARADAETRRKAIENAYEPLTSDLLPDWTSDASSISWLDALGSWHQPAQDLCGQTYPPQALDQAKHTGRAHNIAIRPFGAYAEFRTSVTPSR